MPLCFGAVGLVRARRIAHCASRAIDVHTFCPLTDQPPSTFTALVVNDARSDPAPGSLNIWHQFISPCSVGPQNRSCCSTVPWVMIVGSDHAPTDKCGIRTRAR